MTPATSTTATSTPTAAAASGAVPGEPARTVLSASDIAGLLSQHAPTGEQIAIIEGPLEPLLVVAGAGSGKTETMAARVVYLIANGLVEPDRILGLTFTRKAAGELAERVRRRLRTLRSVRQRRGDAHRSALVGPTVSTYNAYAAALVGDHALRLGLEPSSQLLGEAGRWQLAHEVVERWSTDLEVDLAPSTITAAVLDLAGALAEHLVEPDQLRTAADELVDAIAETPDAGKLLAKDRRLIQEVQGSLRLRSRLVDLVEEFSGRKRQADLVDFGDQVAMAARVAREVPDVGAGERARFGVVLLDEYQDTSVAQLDLLRHLFGGATEGGVGHPVTAVGDPHQSIYGWRGASAGGLERFPENFPRRGPGGGVARAEVLALSTSWRNDHAVLSAANLAAEPLRRASRTAPAALDLPELAARPGAGAGEVSAVYVETLEDEARAVAEFVAQRRAALTAERASATTTPDGGIQRAGVPLRDPVTAAVLCRKRSQFPVMQAALLEAGLPVEVVGLGGLLSTPEVVDLVAALEAAHDPSRGDSLMRLLTGPRARLGLADLHALGDWSAELAAPGGRRSPPQPSSAPPGSPLPGSAGPDPAAPEGDGSGPVAGALPDRDVVDERSIVDALDDLPRPGWTSRHGRALSDTGRSRLLDLAGLLRSLRSQTFLPVVDLVAEAERLLGLDIEVGARPDVDPSTARAHLDAFRSVAAAFSSSSDTGTLGAFLAWLAAAQREERGLEAPVGEMSPDAVQLLTVHAAKGLEWDVVAVPGMVERTFPMTPRTSGWIKDIGSLPTSLRGDRASLPDVRLMGAGDLGALAIRLGDYRTNHLAHHEDEERRLLYVAVTRARSHLLLSGSWWRDGSRPTPPSTFLLGLTELSGGPVQVLSWAADPAAPGPDGIARTPVRPERPAVEPPMWPVADVLGAARHARLEQGALAVETARREAHAGMHAEGVTGDLAEMAELLLEERRRGRAERSLVPLPGHLSTSALVRLAGDPQRFAVQLRRPVPLAPSVHARRGTDFHTWVEGYFGAAALVDVDALPGAEDDSAADDQELAVLRERFLASRWADLTPLAVEVDIETPVGDVVVRSRIDAVFPDPDGPLGSVVVVDWKTGPPPRDTAVLRTRELQLAVYRLAWSRWRGVPIDRVQAAFVYVATGETVRPAHLGSAADIEALLRHELEVPPR